MDTVLIAFGSATAFIVAYHTYGRWLARKIFQLDPNALTPSKVRADGKDYVPSPRSMVFGHHFTSIAGTGPIVGPAIAVIWGWLPALIWVLLGSIFIGAVHDFAALVMSLRNQGRTIGDYCGDIINKRVRLLFLTIIMFALWIVIAIFGLVIAIVFARFPQAVLPVWFQIPIALALGWWVYKKGGNLLFSSIIAVGSVYVMIYLCSRFPALQIQIFSTDAAKAADTTGRSGIVVSWMSPVALWTILLLIYCFIASTLPVQTLLQPRDYINSHQLLISMSLLGLGILVARPEIVAPASHINDPGIDAPFPVFPFLFITVACGACSGFHCLVSSGVSSKQLTKETDAQYVGYGAMLMEGMLAVLIILACCAGLGMGFNGLTGSEAWAAKYANWGAAAGLPNVMTAVISGAGNIMGALHLSSDFAEGIMGVFIACFAATTLDSSTRLQRYVINELGNTVNIRPLKNIFVATGIAVASGFVLAMFDIFQYESFFDGLRQGGKGALKLWPLFGATNQLLAGLALLVATVWLYRKQKPIWITGLPMIFMLFVTGWGLISLVGSFSNPEQPDYFLLTIGLAILILEAWMIVEACLYVFRLHSLRVQGGEMPEMFESA